jgi:hypothetical protein
MAMYIDRFDAEVADMLADHEKEKKNLRDLGLKDPAHADLQREERAALREPTSKATTTKPFNRGRYSTPTMSNLEQVQSSCPFDLEQMAFCAIAPVEVEKSPGGCYGLVIYGKCNKPPGTCSKEHENKRVLEETAAHHLKLALKSKHLPSSLRAKDTMVNNRPKMAAHFGEDIVAQENNAEIPDEDDIEYSGDVKEEDLGLLDRLLRESQRDHFSMIQGTTFAQLIDLLQPHIRQVAPMYAHAEVHLGGHVILPSQTLIDGGASSLSYVSMNFVEKHPLIHAKMIHGSSEVELGDGKTNVEVNGFVVLPMVFKECGKTWECNVLCGVLKDSGCDIVIGLPNIVYDLSDMHAMMIEERRRNGQLQILRPFVRPRMSALNPSLPVNDEDDDEVPDLVESEVSSEAGSDAGVANFETVEFADEVIVIPIEPLEVPRVQRGISIEYGGIMTGPMTIAQFPLVLIDGDIPASTLEAIRRANLTVADSWTTIRGNEESITPTQRELLSEYERYAPIRSDSYHERPLEFSRSEFDFPEGDTHPHALDFRGNRRWSAALWHQYEAADFPRLPVSSVGQLAVTSSSTPQLATSQSTSSVGQSRVITASHATSSVVAPVTSSSAPQLATSHATSSAGGLDSNRANFLLTNPTADQQPTDRESAFGRVAFGRLDRKAHV